VGYHSYCALIFVITLGKSGQFHIVRTLQSQAHPPIGRRIKFGRHPENRASAGRLYPLNILFMGSAGGAAAL
jgi:hypothetical protein